jgi:hypothetical protein
MRRLSVGILRKINTTELQPRVFHTDPCPKKTAAARVPAQPRPVSGGVTIIMIPCGGLGRHRIMASKRSSYRNRDVGGPPKDQPWSWYTVEMMRSDAWRDMSINGRRMLDLLEIEHLAHGGYENGKLAVTYDQFVAGGIRRGSIFATVAELERLGWIEVNRGLYRGYARSAPHRFRLTHRRTRIISDVGAPYLVEATHDWRHYRSEKSNRMVPEPVPPQYRNRHRNGATGAAGSSDTAATPTSASVSVSAPLYRSRAEGGGQGFGRR